VERVLTWDQNEVAVHSLQELDALVDRLTEEAERDTPFMVTLAREDGATLSIGLGRRESTASYVSGSLDPPYYASRGGSDDEGEPIEFAFSGEITEFPPWSGVPAEAARKALRHFYETGELSPEIDWEET
jgi:Immunity protein Imm1